MVLRISEHAKGGWPRADKEIACSSHLHTEIQKHLQVTFQASDNCHRRGSDREMEESTLMEISNFRAQHVMSDGG